MSRFRHHVFVCTNTRDPSDARGCCSASGGEEVLGWFKEDIQKRGLKGVVRANKSGCLDACEFGPAVVVYPDAVWYSPKSQEEVLRIVEQHLQHGQVVPELLIPGMS